jgi:hypothetical protein
VEEQAKIGMARTNKIGKNKILYFVYCRRFTLRALSSALERPRKK